MADVRSDHFHLDFVVCYVIRSLIGHKMSIDSHFINSVVSSICVHVFLLLIISILALSV
jgi:hypothetical protein